MNSPEATSAAAELAEIVEEYHAHDNVGVLFDSLRDLAGRASSDALIQAVQPFQQMPEVVIPLYERIVADRPADARALVVLANAYWLTGRGSDVVGELATRAIAADADNRGAWHLWALAESNVRERVGRWEQVTVRFPEDDLARAALADNAASLAGAEHDPVALGVAIASYEHLLAKATEPAHRIALETALKTLRTWKV